MNVRNNNNNNTSNHHNNNNNQACAACKYQRKKCAPDCILAPYFPHDRQRQFLNAHKLFGVRNITRIIENLDPHSRNEAMRSIIYQSDMRAADPVGGCYRHIQELVAQIQYHEAELELILQQLAVFRAQARHHHHLHRHSHPQEIVDTTPDHLYSPNIAAVLPSPVSHYQYIQQQQQEPTMNMMVVNKDHQHHQSNNNNLQDDVNYWVSQDSMSLSSLSLQNKNGGDEQSGYVGDELYNDHKSSSSSSMLDIHRDDRF
ncbi:LOB domain-containing protein 22-like [Neltuma alba]|uniref:LOB domain-containing protein 22-like n=1 Tax=Neltuma alba TaxID=207710 RepID=UPI0010A45542|nr:LOB domain-containing protein 22-like [Prosopis alba]XP_028778745.1 LOB domain-containing protein 22-like [Prosopis alba]